MSDDDKNICLGLVIVWAFVSLVLVAAHFS